VKSRVHTFSRAKILNQSRMFSAVHILFKSSYTDAFLANLSANRCVEAYSEFCLSFGYV
jgi:hypothetical protein